MTAPSPSVDVSDDAAKTQWGLGIALAALFLGVVGASIGVAVAAAITGVEIGDTTLATSIASLIGMWIVYGVIILVTLKSKGSSSPADDVGLRFRPIDLLIGVGGGLVSSIVVVQLVYVLLDLTSVIDEADLDKLDDPAQRLGDMASGPGFILLALFVGVGAPIMEEVFFRGFLQRAAVRRLGAPVGIVLTAVIFGAVHFQMLQFPALAAFGLVLGLLAHRSGRLGPSIVAHMVFNGLTLAALAAN